MRPDQIGPYMNRDPSVALVALVLMLVAGSVAAIVAALRADRANASGGSTTPLRPAAVREGSWSLVLDAKGAHPIQVVKEIRAITGHGLAEAKELTDLVPSTILAGVDHATATAAKSRLAQAGASVRIVEA
jgi:ribosomal protein L7/L12